MEQAEQISAIRAEIDKGVETILASTIEALKLAGQHANAEPLEQALHRILEACAFHDLVSQRFDRLSNGGFGHDPLLNGPADAGQGLDQAAADRLFDELSRGG